MVSSIVPAYSIGESSSSSSGSCSEAGYEGGGTSESLPVAVLGGAVESALLGLGDRSRLRLDKASGSGGVRCCNANRVMMTSLGVTMSARTVLKSTEKKSRFHVKQSSIPIT